MTGPRIEPVLQTVSVFFTKITAMHSTGHWLHTDYMPRSDQPSTLRGTVQEYQPHCLSNNRWRQMNVWPIAAYRSTQRSSLQLGLRFGGHLALTDFHLEDPNEPRKWLSMVDDSTINIVLCIIITIIIIMPIVCKSTLELQ